jgi:AraC-like DNA-binding protein
VDAARSACKSKFTSGRIIATGSGRFARGAGTPTLVWPDPPADIPSMSPLPLDYRETRPAPPLRPWVECYWSVEGFVPAPTVRPVLPDGCMDLLVSDGPGGHTCARVIGTQRHAAPITLAGPVAAFGIRFRPAGLPAFLPVYAGELVDEAPELADVAGHDDLADLRPLAEVPLGDRPRLADRILITRLSRFAPDRFVARALASIREAQGAPGAGMIANRLGMSRRTLERRFRATVGIGPGALARILRFRRASNRMATRPDLELGRIAQEAGYADQSHFTRDVRDLAGVTPGQLRRLYWDS